MSIIIGIDPDAGKSGFAVWNYEDQRFQEIKSLSFFDIIDYLKSSVYLIKLVRIEAGWLNKRSNWHFGLGRISDKISLKVGMNQMVGKLIAEYCARMTILVEFVKPLGTKFVTSEIFNQTTGWAKKTNQDSRDAACLVWRYGKNNVVKAEKHKQ